MITQNNAPAYDVIIVGAGIGGLWTACRLKRAGYNVIVFEQETIGGVQTMASQGMIHGGQKYALTGAAQAGAKTSAAMIDRWESALGGYGEIDLVGTKILSETQVMWAAGGVIDRAAVFAAAKSVNTKTEKLAADDCPAILNEDKKSARGAYLLPEKVLDTKSLIETMTHYLGGRVFKGKVTEILPDGQVAVNGQGFQAAVVITTAGKGNEDIFNMMKIKKRHTQRRPLQQVMVKTLPTSLYGHGVIANPKPRATITAHPVEGGYVWYLGGGIAENTIDMTAAAAIAHAQREMQDMFPQINWADKEWATLPIDRAEPYNAEGHLPPGPYVHRRGQVLISWPVKLTFAPALGDRIMAQLEEMEVKPTYKTSLPDMLQAQMGQYPWETASWQTITDTEEKVA